MRVRELMSNPPLSVSPNATLRDVAAVLSEHKISGVPVVADGRLLGVVSESDIVDKECGPEEEQNRRRRRSFRRRLRARTCATTAGEAMTSPAIEVEPWMSAYQAAWLMSTHDVNRLPVVDRGRLVGLITRRDLVRHFARPEAEIEQEVRAAVQSYDPALTSGHLQVVVENGRVRLEGEVEAVADLEVVPRIAGHVPGVLAVDAQLHVHDLSAA